ncbi:polysaccharide pyruvyl transferase family protein [Sphingobacterium thalpophilum]|uniref:polysaccharide pyruvyl transferase family protein n=1 Tax=Sphingobacterium thalpophilum TaxID=259 RepID=UPI003DA6B9DC
MNRIAILTQPLGQNYGGIFQNFALQKFIENKLNLSPVTISRKKKDTIGKLSILKNETLNRLRGRYIKIFNGQELRCLTKEMDDFIASELAVTSDIFDDSVLKQEFRKNIYDAVIVGSDQTWRPKYSPNIFNYYLDFLEDNDKIRKIAYASSFGTDEWEYSPEQTTRCADLVKKFRGISVREDSGVDLCRTHLGVRAEFVIDPTLLLNGEDYINMLQLRRNKPKGLYKYVLDKDRGKQKFIETLSQHIKQEVYYCQPKRSLNDLLNYSSLEDYHFPSPYAWIQSFLDADFVVTDSFHGTVFSILFQKKFISLINEGRGASRFYSLLSSLGLDNRLVKNYNNVDLNKLNEDIDFDAVYLKLSVMRQKSIDFLKNNLAI